MPDTLIDRSPRKPALLLTTDHPSLLRMEAIPPISGLPEGRVKVRLRAGETFVSVYVRGADGIRQFLVEVDARGHWCRGPEVAANWRGHATLVSGGDPATTPA